jgi:hypothetical protein
MIKGNMPTAGKSSVDARSRHRGAWLLGIDERAIKI